MAPQLVQCLLGALASLQLPYHRAKICRHQSPLDEELILFRDVESSQPTADGIHPFGRSAVVAVEDIAHTYILPGNLCISPMEKARTYAMKLEAMRHKAGRRSKEETAALEASGKKPMRADEELAQQTGESRSNIQKLVRLNNLTPELQQMVEDKTLPVHTAADLSYLKK